MKIYYFDVVFVVPKRFENKETGRDMNDPSVGRSNAQPTSLIRTSH